MFLMLSSFAHRLYGKVRAKRGKANPLAIWVNSNTLSKKDLDRHTSKFIFTTEDGSHFLLFSKQKASQTHQLRSKLLPIGMALANLCLFLQPSTPSSIWWKMRNKYIGSLSGNIFSLNPIYHVWFKSNYTLKKLKSMLLFLVWPFVLSEFDFTMKRL